MQNKSQNLCCSWNQLTFCQFQVDQRGEPIDILEIIEKLESAKNRFTKHHEILNINQKIVELRNVLYLDTSQCHTCAILIGTMNTMRIDQDG